MQNFRNYLHNRVGPKGHIKSITLSETKSPVHKIQPLLFDWLELPKIKKAPSLLLANTGVISNAIELRGYEVNVRVVNQGISAQNTQTYYQNAKTRLVIGTYKQGLLPDINTIFTFNPTAQSQFFLQPRKAFTNNLFATTSELIDAFSNFRVPLKDYNYEIFQNKEHCFYGVPSITSQNNGSTLTNNYVVEYHDANLIDGFINIPDDGNVSTLIDINSLVGNIPFFVLLYSFANSNLNVNTFYGFIEYEVTLFYEEAGTEKLSHL